MSFSRSTRRGALGRKFGQEKPPLYIAIKQILDRYPDGQIFKVNQLLMNTPVFMTCAFLV